MYAATALLPKIEGGGEVVCGEKLGLGEGVYGRGMWGEWGGALQGGFKELERSISSDRFKLDSIRRIT